MYWRLSHAMDISYDFVLLKLSIHVKLKVNYHFFGGNFNLTNGKTKKLNLHSETKCLLPSHISNKVQYFICTCMLQ